MRSYLDKPNVYVFKAFHYRRLAYNVLIKTLRPLGFMINEQSTIFVNFFEEFVKDSIRINQLGLNRLYYTRHKEKYDDIIEDTMYKLMMFLYKEYGLDPCLYLNDCFELTTSVYSGMGKNESLAEYLCEELITSFEEVEWDDYYIRKYIPNDDFMVYDIFIDADRIVIKEVGDYRILRYYEERLS